MAETTMDTATASTAVASPGAPGAASAEAPPRIPAPRRSDPVSGRWPALASVRIDGIRLRGRAPYPGGDAPGNPGARR